MHTPWNSSRLLKNAFRGHSERSEESLFGQNAKRREIPHFADSVRNDGMVLFPQPARTRTRGLANRSREEAGELVFQNGVTVSGSVSKKNRFRRGWDRPRLQIRQSQRTGEGNIGGTRVREDALTEMELRIELWSTSTIAAYSWYATNMIRNPTWRVEQKDNTCVLWRADGVAHPMPVPRLHLQQYAAQHGLVADIYADLCRQLDETGNATVRAADPLSFCQL